MTTPPEISILGLLPAELDAQLVQLGFPKFAGSQLRKWVFQRLIDDPNLMTDLSKLSRKTLQNQPPIAPAKIIRKQISEDGTIKLLLEWPGGATAETVMIPDGDRRTACVSSQVGCPVGCTFCASGVNGVKGNLTAAQIIEQIFWLNRMLQMPDETAPSLTLPESTGKEDQRDNMVPSPVYSRGRVREGAVSEQKLAHGDISTPTPRITNVVFMGMGEPMANYANVMQAVHIMHNADCFNLGARRITISTVGVPAKMRELAEEKLPLNLAISLHAPNEPLRKKLIPWAEHFALPEILDAARYYFEKTGREITLEYILLSGVNDRIEHANELVKVCRSLRANVNLIRYNEVESLPFQRPKNDDVTAFQEVLRNAGVNAHVRKSRGRDIDAACGQLRRKEMQVVSVGIKTD